MVEATAATRPVVAMASLENQYKKSQLTMNQTLLQKIIECAVKNNEAHVFETIPVVNHRPLDLVRLYEEVVQRGGESVVTGSKKWREVLSSLDLEVPTYTIQKYYEEYLRSFEQQELFNKSKKRPLESTVNATPGPEISTPSYAQLNQADIIRYTPIALGSRRMKMQLQKLSNLTEIQRFVLALDSDIPNEVSWAINHLSILSYGASSSDKSTTATTVDDSNVLYVAKVPAVLDAIHRKLEDWVKPTTTGTSLNHVSEGRILLLLNILRNFSFTTRNQRPMGNHAQLPYTLIKLLLLPSSSSSDEIRQHALDILSCISRFVARGPNDDTISAATAEEPVVVDMPLLPKNNSKKLSMEEKTKSVELLVTSGISDLISSNDRNTVLSCCEIISHLASNKALQKIFELQEDSISRIYKRLVQCLFLSLSGTDRLKKHCEKTSTGKDSGDKESANVDSKVWTTPWGIDPIRKSSAASLVNSGKSAWFCDDDLDHEVRDAALEAIYRLSSYKSPALKLRLCREKFCLERIAQVLISRVGRGEASRIAAGTIANLSMNRAVFPYFLPIETNIALVAAADESLSDLLSNVLADVYGMQSLPAKEDDTKMQL